MLSFLLADPVVSFRQESFRFERGKSIILCNSRHRNHEMFLHREEGPGYRTLRIASRYP